MKQKFFVVGDIHGEYDLLERLLTHWNEAEEQLIFLGDLADRGPQCKAVILKVKQLVEQKGAICVTGNHEDIFLQWLNDPEENLDWYMRNGGQATIDSLLYTNVLTQEGAQQAADKIKKAYASIVTFFQQRPLYYETDHYIFVHAGLNLTQDNWKDTSRRDCIWIRDEFHHAVNHTNKTIVFGHTPVQYLHKDDCNSNIWYRDFKLGIDGGAAYGGALHGVVLDEHGICANYQIYHPNKKWAILNEQQLNKTTVTE